MKPDKESEEEKDNAPSVTGDVIGDTAYSERFVLKILLKLANLDTLKDEINEKSFEDDLCTLWDMTAEKDVVLFLQKYDLLNLFNFALPVIDTPRIVEIIVGIVGNMCCQKEIIADLLNKDSFLTCLLEYIKTDDSLTLIQLLRLVNSSLFLMDDKEITIWMQKFKNVGYANALFFILKNSNNKQVLATALENFNTICSYCNTEKLRTDFFTLFVTLEALESLSISFTEITVNQKESCGKDELERIYVIILQIILNLVGFDKSLEIYANNIDDVVNIITGILDYYENKIANQKEIDMDLIDIIDSTNTVINILNVSETAQPTKYFKPSYNMWKALSQISKLDKNGSSNFEEEDKEELQEFCSKIRLPLSTLMCVYISKCPEGHLLSVLDNIEADYDSIVSSLDNKELLAVVTKRALNYRTRLKENVDS